MNRRPETKDPSHATTGRPQNRIFRVLIIDDDEASRRLSAIYLGQAWPFERDLAVDYAVDGSEALDKLSQHRFALLVLDWRMPMMTGGELLRALRERGVRTPVVVLSALERDAITDNLDELGAGFLSKDNLSADSLRDAIAQSLRLLGFVQPGSGNPTNPA